MEITVHAPTVLDRDGLIRVPLDRELCALMDTTINTLALLAMRWELVCETCVKTLGPIQRRGDESPDVFLRGLELPNGRAEMTAVCAHARRVYDGPYSMADAVPFKRPLAVLDDGSQGGTLTYRLPKTVRDLIVRIDFALRAHGMQMRLFCTVCEDQGLRHRAAGVVGDNPPGAGAFRLTCAHAVRLYV